MVWGGTLITPDTGPEYFQFDLIRKYVISFGHIFDNIVIQRSIANNETQVWKVPIEYAPKDKMMVRLTNDPDLDRPFSAMLPRMAFEMAPGGSFTYDPSRKITSLQKNVIVNNTNCASNNNTLLVQYTGVPYDIHFNLYLYVKNFADGSKILEQILPFFTPDYTQIIDLVPEMGDSRAVPVVIQSQTSYDDLYDGNFERRRVLTYTIPFTMKAWFMGPVRPKPIIKFVYANQMVGPKFVTIGQDTVNTTVNSSANVINLVAPMTEASGVMVHANTYYAKVDSEIMQITAGLGTTNVSVIRAVSNTVANVHLAGSAFILQIVPGPVETVETQPGLSNTGLPVYYANQSIPANAIPITSDYGFCNQTIAGYVD